MGKKKLVWFQPFVGPYRIDLANDLSERFDARIYLKYPDSNDQAFKQGELTDQLHYTPIHLPQGLMFRLLRFLWRELNDFKPDIVITYEFDILTLFCLVWRKLTRHKVRIIGMCDDSYDMLVNGGFSRKHSIARDLLSGCFDDIILVEPDTVDWFRRRFGIGFFFPIIRDEKVVRELYMKAQPIVRRTVDSYGLDGKHVFLFVGRLAAVKNLGLLIKSFANLGVPDSRLVIVGSGPEEERLRGQAATEGVDVIFTGRKDGLDLYVWYLIADTFVLPSTIEPFGAVTNEALIAGCTCLISRKAGSRCLISEGTNGFVFSPDDAAELSSMMSTCVSDRRERNISTMRESKMIYDYHQMFESLCSMLMPESE